MDTKKELKVVAKNEQIEVAKDIFNRYPKANKVIVASDGQAFIADESSNAAKNHATNNAYGKELKLETFTRDEIEVKTTAVSAVELIQLIESAETVEAIEAIIASDTRKTVLAAAAKKIETLKTA